MTICSLYILLSHFWTSHFAPCPVLTSFWPAYKFLKGQFINDKLSTVKNFQQLLWSTQSGVYHSQWSRSSFSGIRLFSLWSNKCWQFDLSSAYSSRASCGSDGKESPAIQETWVWSLGWEDSLEEGMATHSSILAWRISMDKGAWQAAVHRVAKSLTWLRN